MRFIRVQFREPRALRAARCRLNLVEAEGLAFVKERKARAALPIVAQMWRRAEQIARAEAERTLSQIGARLDDRGRRSVEATALAIVRNLLHEPTARLTSAASSGDGGLAGAAAELFGIDAGAPAPRRLG